MSSDSEHEGDDEGVRVLPGLRRIAIQGVTGGYRKKEASSQNALKGVVGGIDKQDFFRELRTVCCISAFSFYMHHAWRSLHLVKLGTKEARKNILLSPQPNNFIAADTLAPTFMKTSAQSSDSN
eukprot:1140168-Pelagomonas_calceolata.AAC.1